MALSGEQQRVVDAATPTELKELAIGAASKVSTSDKREIVKRAGLSEPSTWARDIIWLVVVVAFASIMVGAGWTLAQGRMLAITPGEGALFTPTETVVTLFTTAAAFLAGLLAPSPVGTKEGG